MSKDEQNSHSNLGVYAIIGIVAIVAIFALLGGQGRAPTAASPTYVVASDSADNLVGNAKGVITGISGTVYFIECTYDDGSSKYVEWNLPGGIDLKKLQNGDYCPPFNGAASYQSSRIISSTVQSQESLQNNLVGNANLIGARKVSPGNIYMCKIICEYADGSSAYVYENVPCDDLPMHAANYCPTGGVSLVNVRTEYSNAQSRYAMG